LVSFNIDSKQQQPTIKRDGLMLKLGKKEIEQMLGITPPFQVKNLSVDNDELEITVTIEDTDRPKSSIFSSKSNLPMMKWSHSKLGQYSTLIELAPNENTFSNEMIASQPNFIGPEGKKYTYGLKRMVKFAVEQNVRTEIWPLFIGAPAPLLISIASDLSSEAEVAPKEKTLVAVAPEVVTSMIPPVNDAIWAFLISEGIEIETTSVALDFLLSRTRKNYAKNPNDNSVTNQSCQKLHSFFQKNKKALSKEIDFILEQKISYNAKKRTSQQTKTLTLGPEHPVWNEILLGKVHFEDGSVSFSLKLSHLIAKYHNADDVVKAGVKVDLIKFITLKKRELKKELGVIKSYVLTMPSNFEIKQPNDIHEGVWPLIIEGQKSLDPSFFQLNFFIDSLRNKNNIPESIQELHTYLTSNAARMQKEIIEIAEIAAEIKAKEVS
jgi:hypothetical protein